ncbi:hypothetical protein [Alteromonas sp. KUL49]|uniref:hypothetical protein n=1 Tax=Alteromonas sp. KUL49 TaxID=2480798 RepID=UPI00102EF8D9|nr:hypothetical protein [Alteromonas sp. KUL49]TAP40706.1 hypothetical protein EYS00_06205 [Alteromonas sp. KUL49]GEA10875.1 hypothetical protein KUL49_12500 [Alteromonas sp. KUL49]
MKKTIYIWTFVSLLAACSSTEPKNTNHESEGNLSHSKSIGCETLTKISSKNNPVDIFSGLYQCIEAGNYSTAAELYFVGMSYGYFDTERVSDNTAHQAISVLRMNTFGALAPKQVEAFQAALNSIKTEEICTSLQKIGPPSYQPTYMIQHGMGAFMGQSSNGGIVNGFDSDSAWQKSLSTIAQCKIGS